MSRAPLAAGDAASCAYLGETGNCPDIYLRDRIAGSTTRVSAVAGRRRARRRQPRPQDERGRTLDRLRVGGDEPGPRRHQRRHRRVPVRSPDGGDLPDQRGVGRVRGRSAELRRRTSATTAASSRSSRRPVLSADPDTVACERAPPACLRPFVVDRPAGTTRRVPAPRLVTSRVVDVAGRARRRSRIASRPDRCSSRPTARASP